MKCSENTKERKITRKKAKKLLTGEGRGGIIFKRSRDGARKGAGSGRGNIENDTENERETTVNSEMSFT